MQLTISINKQSIYSSIKLITGYTSKNVGENVDNIMASDDETTLIDDLINAAVSTIVASKRKYVPVVSGNNILFNVPNNFSSDIRKSIEESVERYITNKTLSDWFFISRLPEDSKHYTMLADADMASVSNLFCSRTKS